MSVYDLRQREVAGARPVRVALLAPPMRSLDARGRMRSLGVNLSLWLAPTQLSSGGGRSTTDDSERRRAPVWASKCRGGEESRLRCVLGYLLVAGRDAYGWSSSVRQTKRNRRLRRKPVRTPFSRRTGSQTLRRVRIINKRLPVTPTESRAATAQECMLHGACGALHAAVARDCCLLQRVAHIASTAECTATAAYLPWLLTSPVAGACRFLPRVLGAAAARLSIDPAPSALSAADAQPCACIASECP